MKKFKLDKETSKRFVAISITFTMIMSGLSLGLIQKNKKEIVKPNNSGTSQFVELMEEQKNLINKNNDEFVNLTEEHNELIKDKDGKKYGYDSNLDMYIELDSVGMYEKDPFGHIITREFYESIFIFDPAVNKYLHFYDYGKYSLDENGELIIKDKTQEFNTSIEDLTKKSSNTNPIIFNSYKDYETWASQNFNGYEPINGIMVDEETYNKINSEIQTEVEDLKDELLEQYGYGPKK